MVNALRTLLLNEPADPTAEGEQIIEPAFGPRPLGPAQAAVRRAALPGDWPRAQRNFAATALTRLAQNSPFRPELDALDPRAWLLEPRLEGGGVSLADPVFAAGAVVGGTFAGDGSRGEYRRQWTVAAAPSAAEGGAFPACSLVITDWGRNAVRVATLTFHGDCSEPLFLDGSNVGVFLQWVGVTDRQPGFGAIVTARAPRRYDVLAVRERLRADPSVHGIFAAAAVHGAERARRLERAWQAPGRPHDALAALLAAYAWSFGPNP